MYICIVKLSEIEKKTLMEGFKEMLDTGRDYLIWQTIEIEGTWEMPTAKHRVFELRATERFDIKKEKL